MRAAAKSLASLSMALLALAGACPASAQGQADRVLALHSDGTHLWAGSTAGLWQIDPTTQATRLYTEADGLPSAAIYDVATAPDGGLWVGTDRGPARRVGNRFEAILDGLFSTDTTCVLPTKTATYAGTARGIWKLEANTWKLVYDSHDFARDRVVACAEAPDGAAWFSKGRALTRIGTDGSFRILHHDPLNPDRAVGLDTTIILGLDFDRRGGLWLATKLGPRMLDVNGTPVPLPELPRNGSVGPAQPWQIFVDGENGVWLGFGDHRGAGRGSLAHLDSGERWSMVPVEPGVDTTSIYALTRGPENSLWVGSSTGLLRLGDEGFDRWPLDP